MRRAASEREMRRIASDPEAFEVFYRRHLESVKRFVARRVDDPHLAADLIADIFLAAIDSAHTYRSGRGDPERWLYGVARNIVSGERRRSARELRTANRISGRALVDVDDLEDLLDRIDAEAQARRLYDAMDQLSGADRNLLELVALDGLSIQEAAGILGIMQGAARVRLHRARRLLRGQLPQPDRTDPRCRIVAKEVLP